MAKKQTKPKKTAKAHTFYEAKGELKRIKKTCPKCGPGVHLAKHKNRIFCGKCHYTEFIKE